MNNSVDNNINKQLLKIAENHIPDIIDINSIYNSINLPQTLFIQIFHNNIYLLCGLTNEYRHKQILLQLFDLKTKFKLPNCVFKYISADHVIPSMINDKNAPIFSHAKLVNDPLPLKIMAPCFSTHSYYYSNVGKNIFDSGYQSYDLQIKNIIKEAKLSEWEDKEATIIFKGNVDYTHRVQIIDKLKQAPKQCEFLIYERVSSALNKGNFFQHPIENLCKYRYQLLMNGCGTKLGTESFSIRSKYMLALGCICIYIHLGMNHMEWWMNNEIYDNLIEVCETVDDAIKIINYYEQNPEKAKQKRLKQIKFAETYLISESIDKYWYHLLNVYSKRSSKQFDSPINSSHLITKKMIEQYNIK